VQGAESVTAAILEAEAATVAGKLRLHTGEGDVDLTNRGAGVETVPTPGGDRLERRVDNAQAAPGVRQQQGRFGVEKLIEKLKAQGGGDPKQLAMLEKLLATMQEALPSP